MLTELPGSVIHICIQRGKGYFLLYTIEEYGMLAKKAFTKDAWQHVLVAKSSRGDA